MLSICNAAGNKKAEQLETLAIKQRVHSCRQQQHTLAAMRAWFS